MNDLEKECVELNGYYQHIHEGKLCCSINNQECKYYSSETISIHEPNSKVVLEFHLCKFILENYQLK